MTQLLRRGVSQVTVSLLLLSLWIGGRGVACWRSNLGRRPYAVTVFISAEEFYDPTARSLRKGRQQWLWVCTASPASTEVWQEWLSCNIVWKLWSRGRRGWLTWQLPARMPSSICDAGRCLTPGSPGIARCGGGLELESRGCASAGCVIYHTKIDGAHLHDKIMIAAAPWRAEPEYHSQTDEQLPHYYGHRITR